MALPSARICAALLTLSLPSHRLQRDGAVRSTLRSARVRQCRC